MLSATLAGSIFKNCAMVAVSKCLPSINPVFSKIIVKGIKFFKTLKKEKNFIYSLLKPIYTILLIILFRPKVIGKENIPDGGALIFAGNHKHAVDPTMVMMSTKRIVHYMAKEELFRGLHGILFRKIGLIKIHRGKSNPQAVIEAENILNAGGTIGIFPEGTRNKGTEELLKFRHGAVAIAKKTNTLIMPFAIKNKYKIFKRSVVIEFGKPIDVSNMEIEEANDYLRNEVLKLLRNGE